jgi:hypothetical protein
VNCFSPFVIACVLNQSHGHWLLGDAPHSIISMSLKLNEENEVVHFLDSLMEDDSSVANELVFLASNIRRQICGVLDSSFSFERKYEEKNTQDDFLDGRL